MEIPFSASKMEKINEEEEKSINALEPRETAPALSFPPARGTWDRLPDLVQETIVKMVDERKTLLTCRLVNTAWKKIADKSLEKQSVSEWTKWSPLVRTVQSSLLPKMKLIADWNRASTLGMKWNHSSLPIIVNQKLGSPFPTNSMRMKIDVFRDHGHWPAIYKKENRVDMARELFSSYGNFLTCFSLNWFETNFEVLNGILSDMRNLKALKLTNVKLIVAKEKEDSEENEVEVEEETSPLPNLPSLPNLLHLEIINCDSRVSQLIFNSYSGQITSLETSAYIGPCPQPFTNLQQLKLAPEEKPNLLFPQLGPSPFPSLQYFFVRSSWGEYEWDEIIQVIDRLPKTLVELILDISLPRDLQIKDETLDNIRKLIQNMSTFPSIRKLGIRFPQNKMQTERIGMWLLPRFPHVEVLNLLHYPFQYDRIDGEEVTRDDEGTINNVVTTVAAGFRKECSKVEKIFVYQYDVLVRVWGRKHQII